MKLKIAKEFLKADWKKVVIFLPLFLIVIIFSYLLSCFIIWIYNKAKK